MRSTMAGVVLTCALLTTPIAALAQFAVPDCASLERWSSVLIGAAGPADKYDRAWQQRAAAAREELLSDQAVTATFGRPLSQWGDNQAHEARSALYACKQAAQERGDSETASRLGLAMSDVTRTARGTAARADPDATGLQDPGCQRVATWVSAAATMPDGTSLEARQAQLFADAITSAVFGLGYTQWSDNDLLFASDVINRCRKELLPRGTQTPPGSAAANTRQGLDMAQNHLNNRLRQMGSPRVRPGG